MIIYDSCIRCNSKNIDKIKVNTCIDLNYPEERRMGITSQRSINPSDAIVCKDCGHVEFFIDTTKLNRPL